jgi:colanic acid/amylovoran biosynthesis glycosyltransferase
MKIAMFVGQFPTLSETFILNQIAGLIDLGHIVKIFAQTRGKESKFHQDIYTYNLLEQTYYFNIPQNKLKRIFIALNIILKNIYKSSLAIFKALNFFKYKKLSISLRLLFYIKPFLNEDFDIIHCHFGPNGTIAVYIREILGLDAKIITTFHGHDLRLAIEKSSIIYKELFDKCDLFQCVSNYTRDSLIKLGISSSKLINLPLGIDVKKFPLKWDAKNIIKDDNNIIILTVARLVEEKGLFYGIKAIEQVYNKYKNIFKIKYYIIGYGNLYRPLEDYINAINMKNTIYLLGGENQDEIVKYIKMSDIFLLPSINESFGMVLLEAQAVGLPVIATSVGGTKYAMVENKSGFLVPEKDVDALVEKIEYLLNHPELWPRMGRAGRRFVEEKYDIVKLIKKLERVYEALINNNISGLESL